MKVTSRLYEGHILVYMDVILSLYGCYMYVMIKLYEGYI